MQRLEVKVFCHADDGKVLSPQVEDLPNRILHVHHFDSRLVENYC